MIEQTSEHKSISVIGSGSWGTALALQLSGKNNPVKLWGRNPANIKNINSTRENKRYLPGITIPNNINDTKPRISVIGIGGFNCHSQQ